MSLLLDALKRAEQEKLARQGSGVAPAATPLRAAPAPASAPPGSLELQPIAHAGDAHAAPPRAAAPRPDAAHAAQNVFQAKAGSSAAAAAAAEEPRNRTVLWATVGAIAVVAIAAGAYVWYSVTALTPQYASSPRPRAAPTPPPASSAPLPPTAAMGSIVPAPGAVPATVEVATEPSKAAPSAIAPAPPTAARATPAETAAERIAREAPPHAAPEPLRMDRAPEAPRRVPAELAQGYQALRQGDLAAARRSYDAALASDPGSVDANLGLATIAARGANRNTAAEHYRRVLEADPRNATALAGLAALADFSRPDALEAQLRSDLARAPESAALQFTLGNLYASQSRWSEAQSAYFEAHRLDPGSADIAYNLAVSLDQLGQRRAAADFYARAIEASRERSGQFDPNAAARRLAELR